MTTIAQRLAQVELKVKRANKHIGHLQSEVAAFLQGDPYKVGFKIDPQSGYAIYYVSAILETPECLPLIAGDVIQNLVSALDHLAYQLICSDTADKPPNERDIYFPIGDSLDKYETRKTRKMKGALPGTLAAIDALKPYKGGNDQLWMLQCLNNIEKHRTLLTVGSMNSAVHIAPTGIGKKLNLSPALAEAASRFAIAYQPKDKGFPLKVGFVLLEDRVNKEFDPNHKFTFDIAINEPGVIESESIIGSLHQLATLVEGIVTALSSRLRDTP